MASAAIEITSQEDFLIHYNDFKARFAQMQPEKEVIVRDPEMDVEGYEWNTIKGGKRILEENHDIKLIFEFFPMALRANDVKPDSVLNYLLDAGFHIYVIDENMRLLDFSTDEFCIRHANYSAMNLFCERTFN